MSNSAMPIREYLRGEFNEQVNASDEDPFEAFVRLETALGARAIAYDTYAQATITSGGHARNPNLSWLEIVQKNVAFAKEMAEDLYASGTLDPAKTIEASTLGLIDHWRESDYITFWLQTIGRPDVTGVGSAGKVDTMRELLKTHLHSRDIDLDSFNDYTKSAADRAPNYFTLADAFVDALQSVERTPVARLVAVSEIGNSLGANTERYFAKRLDIRVFGLAIARLGAQTLPADYPRDRLVADTDDIVRYGGQVFDTRDETRIIIVLQK